VTPTAATKSGDSVNSVTNIYITIPPHTDLGGLGGFDRLGGLGGSQLPLALSDGLGDYPLKWQQYTDPLKGTKYNQQDFYDPGAGTWKQGYQYDPATGTLTGPPGTSQGDTATGEWTNQGIGYDALSGAITFGPQFVFKKRKK
jgi:hypothetical protein